MLLFRVKEPGSVVSLFSRVKILVTGCLLVSRYGKYDEGGSIVSALRLLSTKRMAMRNRTLITAIAICSFMAQTGVAFAQAPAQAATVRVDATPGHAINSFDPDSALGSSIDVLSRTDINEVYSPHIIAEALSAGWGPITYRNNTELRMAAWHWTENGVWSDAAHRSGYFTGSSEFKEPTRYILAYALPHRGFATSGDRPIEGPNLTYWKSNPYLTSKFTGESDTQHPQWVIVDLKVEKPISAVRIQWASPYASTYQVEYWSGTNALDFDGGPRGEWRVFLSGVLKKAQGGTVTLKLTDRPVSTRYMRILMTESSDTCDEHGSDDIRNCVGYPIGYVEMGEEPDGKHAMPEDYGALYLQWATAIHKIDPKLKLGGPIFEGVNEDIRVWPDAQGRTSWMGR